MPTRPRPPGTPDVDLTDSGDFGILDGAVFMTGPLQPAGSGVFNSFVQIQHNGVEQGYNTDAGAQFDEKSAHPHNHSILLAEVPIVIGDGTNGTVEGVTYREFLLDLNEPTGGSNPYISLDALQIWQEESGSLTNFTPGSGFAGAHTNYLAYNLDAGGDHWIALTDGLAHGSGQSDVRILIPDSVFINDAAHRYVTLYSEFGLQSGWDAAGGFEEWGLHGASGGNVSAIALNKTASVPGGSADHAGEIITYSLQLSNTGNTSLTGVTVIDPSVSDLTRGADIVGNNDNVLNVGEVWSFTAHHTVTQDDIDNAPLLEGVIANTATADTDQTGPVSANVAVPILQDPHVTLTKAGSVPGGTADTPNEVISYTITVFNDGNVTLDPVVFDPDADTIGPVDNLASPVLTPDTSGEDIIGDTNGNHIQDPGEVWTFHNAGDVNQDGTQDFGEIFLFHNAGDTNNNGRLDVGETWQYAATRTVTQDDIDNGGIVDPDLAISNTAHVVTSQGAADDDSASVPIEQRPHLTLAKSATVPGGTADHAGEVISYAITVTNDGNMTLTNPVVSDPSVSDLAAVISGGFNVGDADADGKLDVGEIWQYSASHTVTQAEIDNGGVVDPELTIDNTASVTTDQATDINDHAVPGASDSASASVPVAQNPHVSMSKTASVPGGTADAGESISYAIGVTNVGNMTLTHPLVDDPFVSDLAAVMSGGFNIGDTNADGKLSVGETWQYTADHTVTAGEASAGGTIDNTASVTTDQATDINGDPVAGASASASASVPVTPVVTASMTFDKSDAVGTIFVDSNENGHADATIDLIEFILQVHNTGSVALTNITFDDPLLGGIISGPAVLNPGDSFNLQVNHFLTAADVAAGHVFNQATATALDPSSNLISVMAHYDQLLPA